MHYKQQHFTSKTKSLMAVHHHLKSAITLPAVTYGTEGSLLQG